MSTLAPPLTTAPAHPTAFTLVVIPSAEPGETWWTLDRPLRTDPEKPLLLFLLSCVAPTRAGGRYCATVRQVIVHRPEEEHVLGDPSLWLRQQAAAGRARVVEKEDGMSQAAVVRALVERLKQHFLPPGATVSLPPGLEEDVAGRPLSIGMYIGAVALEAVHCAFCGQPFSAEVNSGAMLLQLRLAPDGPIANLYGCPNCLRPGLAASGEIDLCVGGDGIPLAR